MSGKAVDAVGWGQYNPWRKEEEKGEKKQKQVNTATIWCWAKKLIAREWARAKGIKRRDPRIYAMERTAAQWREKREEERKRSEEKRARIQRQRERLEGSLRVFAEKLSEIKDTLTAEEATTLFEEALERVGEIIEVKWTEEGCDAWIEPWEERRLRRKRGGNLPFIYKIRINKDFGVVYELVENEEVIRQQQAALILKPLRISLDGGLLTGTNKGSLMNILGERLGEVGRLLSIHRSDGGWSAKIEPWDEVRLRNKGRKGRPPFIIYGLGLNERLDVVSYEKIGEMQAEAQETQRVN